ncbi:SMP-30/gluconolaconase/LRE domain protein [Paenibacillus darwinianus]|uniref:Regucalcin n=1 Tax=Paenibacillus darwinianus TaxID=1380763 RepID=A0A9W5RYN5_9BACL|nr:SMP-30/gluconolaconase/LRE domain protein [Paenibacillus darwinianus]EXX84758.1 SMP-30/gluconolaconase/LRE domain protein [Paenibacillus darwinianus]
MFEAACVIDAKAALAEGPVWDERLNELIWIDIEGYHLHRYRPSDGRRRQYELPLKAGAAVPAEDGSWILALEDGFYRFDWETSLNPALIARKTDDSDAPQPMRMNDGKCDPQGRFWAGTMNADNNRLAALFTLDPQGRVTKRLSGVVCSNGLAWTADGNAMYYIDTPTRVVSAFDFNGLTGELTNRRTVVSIPEGEGSPDGMAIDAEGMLWVAHWGGWQVSRWNPTTGEKLAAVRVPAANVTSCAFGGEGLDELYITTARTGLRAEEADKQPLAGGIFTVNPGVNGLPVARYRG